MLLFLKQLQCCVFYVVAIHATACPYAHCIRHLPEQTALASLRFQISKWSIQVFGFCNFQNRLLSKRIRHLSEANQYRLKRSDFSGYFEMLGASNFPHKVGRIIYHPKAIILCSFMGYFFRHFAVPNVN